MATVIAAHGATVSNVLGQGERGIITTALGATDAGYTVVTTIMGTPTLDGDQAVYFTGLDEARRVFDHVVEGIHTARVKFGG